MRARRQTGTGGCCDTHPDPQRDQARVRGWGLVQGPAQGSGRVQESEWVRASGPALEPVSVPEWDLVQESGLAPETASATVWDSVQEASAQVLAPASALVLASARAQGRELAPADWGSDSVRARAPRPPGYPRSWTPIHHTLRPPPR
jgi:hypothetical protein